MQGLRAQWDESTLNRLKQQWDSTIKNLNAQGKVSLDLKDVNNDINKLESLIKNKFDLKLNTAPIQEGLKDTVKGIDEAIAKYKQFGEVSTSGIKYDNNGNLQSFIVQLKTAEGLVSKLKMNATTFEPLSGGQLKPVGYSVKSVSVTDNTNKIIEQQIQAINKAIEQANTEIKQSERDSIDLANAMGKVREQSELRVQSEQKAQELAQVKLTNQALEEEYQNNLKLADAISKAREQSELKAKSDEKSLEIAQSKAINKALEDQYASQQKEVNRVNGLGEFQSNFDPSLLNKTNAEIKSYMQNLLGANTQIMNIKKSTDGLGQSTVSLTTNVKSGNGVISQEKLVLDQATGSIYKESEALKQVNDHQGTFADRIKQAFAAVTSFAFVTTGFYSLINAFKQGVSSIMDIDTAMIDLKKVTNETADTYENFIKIANDMAISVGHSTEAAINATTYFAKLGYSLKEASDLAKDALTFSNIGDMNIDEASTGLISTMKGFGLEADKVNKIMDVANEIGNNYSTTTKGVTDALQRSSSALHEANNSLEQSVGLIVAANDAIQDPEKVGTALKTISMRLRGIDDETGELIPKLRETIETISGVDIMKDDNTFKSTYEILQELSPAYDKLNDKQKAYLQELIAGKQQGNVFAGLMQNMSEGAKAYDTAMNSMGSATKEQETYMTSITAKTNEFKESIKKIWIDSISSSTIKGFVSDGTSVIGVIDKMITTFGGVPTVVGLASAAIFAFNKNLTMIDLTKLGEGSLGKIFDVGLINSAKTAIGNFSRSYLMLLEQEKLANGVMEATPLIRVTAGFKALTATTIAQTVATGALRIATIALNAVIGMGIGAVVSIVVEKFMSWHKSADELKDSLDQLRQESQSNISTNNQNIQQLQKLQDEYDALREKTNLTAEEQKKLNDLNNQIAQMSPEIVTGYDKQGNAIINLKNGVGGLIDQLKEKNRLENLQMANGFEDAQKNYNTQSKKLDKSGDYKNAIDDKSRATENIRQAELDRENAIMNKNTKDLEFANETIRINNEIISKSNGIIEEHNAKLDTERQKLNTNAQAVLTSTKGYEELSDTQKQLANDMLNNLKDEDLTRSNITGIIDKLNSGDIREQINALNNLNMNKASMSAEEFKNKIDDILQKISELLGGKYSTDSLAKIFNIDTSSVENATNSIKSLSDIESDLAKSISDAKGQIESVNKVLAQHQQTGQWDLDTIYELASNGYPQLLGKMNDDKALQEELINITHDKTNAVTSSLNEQIKLQANYINQLLVAYNYDVKAFNSAEEAKNAIAKTGINQRIAMYNQEADQYAKLADSLSGVDQDNALRGAMRSSELASMEHANYVNASTAIDTYFQLQQLSANVSSSLGKIGTGSSSGGGSSKSAEDAAKAAEQLREDMLQNVKDVEQAITDVIKKEYEKRKQAIEDEYTARKESLQKQKDLYDQQNETDDYNKNLKKEQDTLNSLKSSETNARRDTSLAGQARLRDILQQEKDQQDKIEQMVLDHTRSTNDKMFDDQMNLMDKEKDQKEKDLDNQFSDENISKMVNEAMTTGQIKGIGDVLTAYKTFQNTYNSGLTASGQILQKEFIDKWAKVQSLIKGTAGVSIGVNFGTLPKYKDGGIISHTGMAWVDGTPDNPELALNGKQAVNLLRNLSLGGSSTPKMSNSNKQVSLNINTPLISVTGGVNSDVMTRLENFATKIKDDVTSSIMKEFNNQAIYQH